MLMRPRIRNANANANDNTKKGLYMNPQHPKSVKANAHSNTTIITTTPNINHNNPHLYPTGGTTTITSHTNPHPVSPGAQLLWSCPPLVQTLAVGEGHPKSGRIRLFSPVIYCLMIIETGGMGDGQIDVCFLTRIGTVWQ